jgi:hypothetical protein
VIAWFVFALVLALGGVESRAPGVDAKATAAALRIRVGARAMSWTIAIEPTDRSDEVRVRMRHGSVRELERSFVLHGDSGEQRSRELAAALALVIEQHATDTSPVARRSGDAARSSSSRPPEGWLALGARTSVGQPPDPEGGITLRGGALWGRGIVQPLAVLGSAHARRQHLRVDGLRVGAGLAIGHVVPAAPLWLGGSVVPQLAWTLARGRGHAGGSSSITELAALAQLRLGGVLAALRLGIELGAPPLRASDRATELRFGVLRFVIGIEVGMTLPPRRRAP